MQTIEAPLIEGFIQLNTFFQDHKIRYCIIGGLAAGYWGIPRFTKDVDFTVVSRTGNLTPLLTLMKKNNFHIVEKGPGQMQITGHDSLRFEADIILAETDYQDWVVQRARPVPMFNITAPICSPEDLIILKLIANRRQDLLDIENVLKNCANQLDKKYLQEWMKYWDLTDRFQKEFSEI